MTPSPYANAAERFLVLLLEDPDWEQTGPERFQAAQQVASQLANGPFAIDYALVHRYDLGRLLAWAQAECLPPPDEFLPARPGLHVVAKHSPLPLNPGEKFRALNPPPKLRRVK